jgi:uncharacterized YigZ family protein
MSLPDPLYIPAEETEYEWTVRRSRFIARLVPVRSQEEAEAALTRIRSAHQTATHNCYAWRVGLEVPAERFSDDGEPGGTAGRPILDALRHVPVTQCLVVVTRYFGGILLGAGGLVHAYSDSTVNVLQAARLLRCRTLRQLQVECGYDQYGRIEHELDVRGTAVVHRDFGVDVKLEAWVEEAEATRVAEALRDATAGRARIRLGETAVMGVDSEGKPVVRADRW